MPTAATLISTCTVRIEATGPGQTSVGTGYFYNFPLDPARNLPVIITNKHVVDGATRLRLMVQVSDRDAPIQLDGSAQGERCVMVELSDLSKQIVMHPDQTVDLCAVLVAYELNKLVAAGRHIKHQILGEGWRLTATESAALSPIEPIVMVGYPNGLWDELNNRPLVRQGMTASHALVSWNGRREFTINCACFGGSSGSPVFAYRDGLIKDGPNSYTPGSRATLLGTLWGGPILNMEGRLEKRPIPTSLVDVPVLPQMLNLGFVIQATAIDDLAVPIHMRMATLEKSATDISAAMEIARRR